MPTDELQNDTTNFFGSVEDTLAEWLRRRPAKPVGSAREGSNPSGVGLFTGAFCDIDVLLARFFG